MITESEVRDALVRRAETFEVPPHDLMRLRAAAMRRRRGIRLRYAAMGAAGLLAVGLVWGQRGVDPGVVQPADGSSDVTISPSCFPTGAVPPVPDSPWTEGSFLSDDPVSATASGGRSCTLVLRYGFHRFGAGSGISESGGEPGLSGMVFLFSNGRLIVDTATEQDWFVQWERRLTPAGVERMRSAVVAMLDVSASRPGASVGDRIQYGDDSFYPKDGQALVRLLTDRSWLPAQDWVDESPSIYRAAWYLTCYQLRGSHAVDAQEALRELPSRARNLLELRAWTRVPLKPEKGVARYQCLVLSRADAKELVEALGGDLMSGQANVFQTGLGGAASDFSVHALMPDGTSGAHGD